ncbi:MAG: CinA family nicotinamide mononucleotide deamidase-related protein [Planctomycetia bacterium]|nr:CinA family nicotinamide mononucleotide deamidase-related protein [Planctomycetia bacterium]
MHAEIISIGDEIASGQLLDTNSQWLSQRLGELGIHVLYHATVGDEVAAGVAVFRQAIDRADVVVATGGLGPTADDLTREVLAQATGRGLVRDDEALAHIRRLFARRGWPMPEQNEVQAMLPGGSRLIPNPHGTAPGIAMDVPREGRSPCRLFVLPGVPAEMVEMWHETVAGALRQVGEGGRVIRHRLVKCFGAGESRIESMLPDLIRRGRIPRVGITASKTTIILRITAEGATEQECFAATEPTVATIRQCLGELVFGEGEIELEDVVVRLLGERRRTLAVAEWGTAGRVTHALRSAAGAEGRVLGGIAVADNQILERVLDVPPALVAKHSAASAEVAEAMAVGVRGRFGADYGLAVSRFPEFDEAQPKPVFFALATPEGVRAKSLPFASHPAILDIFCAKTALNLARLELSRAE